jgi:hypothetical protein
MTRPAGALAGLLATILLGCGGPVAQPAGPGQSSLRTLAPDEFVISTMDPPGSATPPGCPAALISGTLIDGVDTGLGIQADGAPYGVIWPFGSVGRHGPPAMLVDANGNVQAHVGEAIRIGGGFIGAGHTWMACGDIDQV